MRDGTKWLTIAGTQLPLTRQGAPAQESVQGFVLMGANIHEEATEEDLTDFFSEFGSVKSLHLNLDRQTGYVKGYVLVEFGKLVEAQRALNEGQGEQVLGREILLDYAFVEDRNAVAGESGERGKARERSPSRYGSLA